jgi:alkanesulfonate monooxygenase SsuD/methylene tetrahydromethanopterin reductase-like flavin-dependent oxidoreductase (luciferase family)
MRLGLLLIPTDPWDKAVARARQIEDMGFDHLWTYDHLSWRRFRDAPWFGALAWLAGIAASTRTIRLGTMVTSPNFRQPVVLAKEAMTIDHISHGRLTLGVGAGGTGYDATVLGDAVLTPGQRAARLGDFVEVLDGLLRNTKYSGSNDHYVVSDARMTPGCAQQPRLPVWVAAGGARTMRIAAMYGDGWILDASVPTFDQLQQMTNQHLQMLDSACAGAGRDVPTRAMLVSNAFGRPLADVDSFARFYEWCAGLGFTDLVMHDPRPNDPLWNDDPRVLEQVAARFCL